MGALISERNICEGELLLCPKSMSVYEVMTISDKRGYSVHGNKEIRIRQVDGGNTSDRTSFGLSHSYLRNRHVTEEAKFAFMLSGDIKDLLVDEDLNGNNLQRSKQRIDALQDLCDNFGNDVRR